MAINGQVYAAKIFTNLMRNMSHGQPLVFVYMEERASFASSY